MFFIPMFSMMWFFVAAVTLFVLVILTLIANKGDGIAVWELIVEILFAAVPWIGVIPIFGLVLVIAKQKNILDKRLFCSNNERVE